MQKFTTLAAIAMLLVLAACAKGMQTSDASITSGQYRISAIEISMKPEFHADQIEDYNLFKPFLEEALTKKLAGKGTGRQVILSVQFRKVNTTINKTRALLIGDGYYAGTDIVLLDATTRQLLGSDYEFSRSSRDAFVKSLADDISGNNSSLKQFADYHSNWIIRKLYP